MNSLQGSDDKNNNASTKIMEYLQKTGGIAQGILDHRMDLPWKYILDEYQISVLVGDHLISYLILCLDFEQLLRQDNLHDLVRPLLENYLSMEDLESIGLNLDDPNNEIVYTKTEFDKYIIIAKIMNYPIELIQYLEVFSINAPESVMEAEIIEQQIVDSRRQTLLILDRISTKK